MSSYYKFDNMENDENSTNIAELQEYRNEILMQQIEIDRQITRQNKNSTIIAKMSQNKQSMISSINSINSIHNSLLSQDRRETVILNEELHREVQQQQASKVSFNAAMFSMMAAAMGTGIFNLPLRITQIGIVMFAIYVCLAGVFSYTGCILLQKMIAEKGFNSYGQICTSSYGNAMKRLGQVCLILFPWAIAVCFQVIMAKFIVQLLTDVFNLDLYQDRAHDVYNSKGNTIRIVTNVIIICLDFILIQLKDMKVIQRLAVIGVCSVIYNAITIFILLFTGFTHKANPHLEYHGIFQLDWSIIEWALFQNGWFSMHAQAIASILFCYINHQLVFPTCKNMENPTNSRLKACFFRSNLNQLVVYTVIGLSGYLLLMQHQKQFPIGPMVLTSISVWPMTLGKALMVITLFLAVPLNMFPARTILKQALAVEDNTKNHYILSVGLALSSSIVAITFVKVNSYFGLLGGTAGVLMGGGIPALCFWKTIMKDDQKQQNWKNYTTLVLCGVICVIGFIGAILSVVDPV